MFKSPQLNFNEPPILRVEDLTVYRGNYPAVREVSFELLPGTNTAVIGPNGSGKSTLIQAILDVFPRTSGKVEIFGRRAGVTGLVMTKLDGTARGGILVAIAKKYGLPVHFIGVGEGVDDLSEFTARDFARAVVGVED